ncbi:MAG: diadenylate cyclase CdaA [Dehalococcoidia bacterium]
MPGIPDGVNDVLQRFDAAALLDILIISFSIYWLLLLIRGTAAMTVLRGAGVLLVAAFLLSRVLDLPVLSFMLRSSVAGLVIAMAIIFQPEIRRALERVGRTGMRTFLRREEHRHAVDRVLRAATRLARQGHGALIVLERETGLQDVIDTGIALRAEISVELLTGIFVPGAPLHDGAAIVRGNIVVAAGCTLTLSDSQLPSQYGMRHRAGLGITESTDAVVVIVSEEHGEISVASNGRMVTELSEERLSRQLHRLFGLEEDEPALETPQPAGAGEATPAERRSG